MLTDHVNKYGADPSASGGKPLFLYYALQNVHEPLQLPTDYDPQACKDVVNSQRRQYCALTHVADEALGQLVRSHSDTTPTLPYPQGKPKTIS